MKGFVTQTLAGFKGLDLTSEGVDTTESDYHLAECINFEVSDRGSLVKRPGIRPIGRGLPVAVDSPVLLGKVKSKLAGQYEPILLYLEGAKEVWGLLDTDTGVGWVKLHTGNFPISIHFGRNELINLGGESYFPGSFSETGTAAGIWKYSHNWNVTTNPADAGVLSTVASSPRASSLALLTDRLFALDPYSIAGEDRVYFTNAGTYEVWNTGTNYISFKEIKVTNIVEYKERLAIFSNNKIWLLDTTQGGPLTWTRTIFSHNLGSYSYEGTTSYSGWLYFLDNSGLYRTDYSTIELLSTKLNRLFHNRTPVLYTTPNNLDGIAAYNNKIYMTIGDEFGQSHTYVYDLFRETWTEFSYRFKTAYADKYSAGANFLPITTGSRDRLGHYIKKGGGEAGVVEPGLYLTAYNTANEPVEVQKAVYLYADDDSMAVRKDSEEEFTASFKTQRLLFKENTSVKRCPEVDLWYSTKDNYDLVYTTDDSYQETVPLETVPGINEGIQDWAVQRVRGPQALFRNLQVQVRTAGDEEAEFGALVFKYKPYKTTATSRPAITKEADEPSPITLIPEVVDTWHNIGDLGEPAFQNSWEEYDTAVYGRTRFRKDNGIVYMQGLIKAGTMEQVAFTLPVGYRPGTQPLLVSSLSNGLAGRFEVHPSGGVKISTSSASWITMNVIYPAEGEADWHTVGTAGEPAFQNSWVDYPGTTFQDCRFTQKSGIVYAQGLAAGTAAAFNTTIWYMPASYFQHVTRPRFAITCGDPHGAGFADVFGSLAPGAVQTSASAKTWNNMQPIVYPNIPDSEWRYVGAVGQPAFQAPWIAVTGDPNVALPRFTKINDVVYIQGIARNGTAGTTVFFLPDDYRPPYRMIFLGNSAGVGRIDVTPTGNVIPVNITLNTSVNLTVAYSVKTI